MRVFKGKCYQSGFTYIFSLVSVALLGLASVTLLDVDSLIVQREKEKELLFIGHQFRDALKRYYEAPVLNGASRQYPIHLTELLEDSRSGVVLRHLRKIYVDPMTGHDDWGVKVVGGRIVGIYSLSEIMPFKQDRFDVDDSSFRNAATYGQWVFSYPPIAIH